jgi:F-type H+-transporting ATPase subunit b
MEESLMNGSFILFTGGFGINTDVFETNLINQLIILGALFVLGGDALKTSLADRNNQVKGEMDAAVNKLSEAVAKYTEIKKDVIQARVFCGQIRKDSLTTKSLVLKLTHEAQRLEYEKMLSVASRAIGVEQTYILEELQLLLGQLSLSLVLSYFDSLPLTIRNEFLRIYKSRCFESLFQAFV